MLNPAVHVKITGRDPSRLQEFPARRFSWQTQPDPAMRDALTHAHAEGRSG